MSHIDHTKCMHNMIHFLQALERVPRRAGAPAANSQAQPLQDDQAGHTNRHIQV